MKKVLFSLMTIMAILLIVFSCKNDGGGSVIPTTNTVKNYFNVEGANYVGDNLPAPTIGEAPTVSMNYNVIPGGSNYVTVSSMYEAAKILVGIEGTKGYYEMVPDNRSVNEIVYDMVLVMSQELEEGSFNISIGIIDEDGEISEYFNTEIAVIVVGTGTLQVSLSFDNNKDVDLHLIEPNGYHIYYGNRISDNGGILDLDSNPSCQIDEVNNENITYSDSAYVEPGLYTVYVDMWNNCDPSVATNFVLTVLYGGEILQTVEGVNPIAGTFPVNTPNNYGDIYNISPVCHFNIPDNGQAKPAKSLKKDIPKFLRSEGK